MVYVPSGRVFLVQNATLKQTSSNSELSDIETSAWQSFLPDMSEHSYHSMHIRLPSSQWIFSSTTPMISSSIFKSIHIFKSKVSQSINTSSQIVYHPLYLLEVKVEVAQPPFKAWLQGTWWRSARYLWVKGRSVMPMELAFALVERLFLVVCYIILSHDCWLWGWMLIELCSIQWKRRKRRKNHVSENYILYGSLLAVPEAYQWAILCRFVSWCALDDSQWSSFLLSGGSALCGSPSLRNVHVIPPHLHLDPFQSLTFWFQ